MLTMRCFVIATLWVYLPRYFITAVTLPKRLLVYTFHFLKHAVFICFSTGMPAVCNKPADKSFRSFSKKMPLYTFFNVPAGNKNFPLARFAPTHLLSFTPPPLTMQCTCG